MMSILLKILRRVRASHAPQVGSALVSKEKHNVINEGFKKADDDALLGAACQYAFRFIHLHNLCTPRSGFFKEAETLWVLILF